MLLALASVPACTAGSLAQTSRDPDTVVVYSGALRLRALLWHPHGRGPFPAILFNHGSGHGAGAVSGSRDQRHPEVLGPVFARHGYVFLYLFRRGDGLSAGQGTSSGDLMDREFAAHGQDGRNRIQLRLLETDEMSDAIAGLAFLRALPEVDPVQVAVVGHSFGGSLTLLLAERDSSLCAAVVFAAAGYSWERSPPLRARLLEAVGRTVVPIFFIHAANDYSVMPGTTMAAEMERLGKPHRVKLYPPLGRTREDGHDFVHRAVSTWEPDVFAFLNEHMRRPVLRASFQPFLRVGASGRHRATPVFRGRAGAIGARACAEEERGAEVPEPAAGALVSAPKASGNP